jgi:hypothetical protein
VSDLETLIRDAVKRGEFNHLSVAVTGMRGDTFKAFFRPATANDGAHAVNKDPVAACIAAMEEGLKRRRGPRKSPKAEDADEEMDFG